MVGQSVVGDFLRNLLATPLGSEDASDLAHILVECQLVPDAESFRRFYR